jgi:hypothetical protein
MSYDIEYVASVIVTSNELQHKLTFEDYLSLFAPLQQDLIKDILCDLDRIKMILKPVPWYDPEPAWNKDREEIWVWVEDIPETIPL